MKARDKRPAPRESVLRDPPPATPQSAGTSRLVAITDTDPSVAVSDPGYKKSAVRSINAYLAAHNAAISISLNPLSFSSAKDITDAFRFLLSRLDFAACSEDLEDDLLILLKYLNCPHKINKSDFCSPNSPHSFPHLLALMHWLLQIAVYAHHLRSDQNSIRYAFMGDNLMAHVFDSYLLYVKGDDQAAKDLDKEFVEKMEREQELLMSNLNLLDEEGKKLELELQYKRRKRGMTEREKKSLEEEEGKFQGYINTLKRRNSSYEKELEELQQELAAKEEEIRQTREKNEELKKKVGYAELLAVERDMSEAEASWKNKLWDFDVDIKHKFKELVAVSMECNWALKSLKLRGDFGYVLNAKGSTPAQVMGINYKSTIKPAINSFADEIKESTTRKLEEFVALKQQSEEMTAKIEAKSNRLAALESHLFERMQQFDMARNEIEAYTSWCLREAQTITEDVEAKACNLDIMAREAVGTLRVAVLKLEEEMKQCEQKENQSMRDSQF